MAQVVIKVKGINKINRFYLRLGPEMMKQIMQVNDQFMSAVQKSAKLRAPRWSGKLAKSIRKHAPKRGTEAGNIIITVDSPYGVFQEFGFRKHGIGASFATRAGSVFGQWQLDKGQKASGGKVFKPFKPSGYFIGPAIEQNLSNLPNMLIQGARKAIAKSGV